MRGKNDYIASLYGEMACLDLSIPENVSKAHAIINMIEQVHKFHLALENPAPTREERLEAFKRR